jgi:hypothetical protein
MRELGKRRAGAIGFALSASFFASGLATVSIAAVSDHPTVRRACLAAGGPTNFDFLVLASIADSPQLHAMATFHSRAGRRRESGSCDKNAAEHQTDPATFREEGSRG